MQTYQRTVLTLGCGIFLALGLITAATGPVLPELAAQTGSALAAVGAAITALFLGSLASQVVTGPIIDRWGQRPVQIAGILLLALGNIGILLSRSLPLTLVAAVVAGLGHGLIDVGLNVLIADAFAGSNNVSALNLLHLFFGVGAVTGPALVSGVWRLLGTGLPALWVGALALLGLLIPILRLKARRPALDSKRAESGGNLYRSPLLWLLGGVLLLYVGTENGLGSWIAAYMTRTVHSTPDSAALVASGFWLTLTIGRLLGAGLGVRVRSHTLLALCLGGAALSSLLLALTPGLAHPTIAAVLALGFCFGAIYPTAMAVATGTFAHAPGKAVSLVAALGSIGGMGLPYLQGRLLEQVSPGASMQFVAVSCGLMLAFYGGIHYLGQEKRRDPVAEQNEVQA